MKNFKIVLLIVAVFIIIFEGYLIVKKFKKEPVAEAPAIVEKEPISLCYFYSNKTDRGLYDKASLRLDLSGEKVTGEFNNIPAEKDSKVGKFEGTVGPLDQSKMGRTANVWWDSLGEGMKVKEELIVEFGDGSASTLFGEMTDRGDGVYVYKDKKELSFGPSLSQISCEDLDEKTVVENYIKNNIKTIATNKPVLGGSWYMTSVFVIPYMNSGTVTYEDGHIESKADFTYDYNENTKNVVIKTFLQNK